MPRAWCVCRVGWPLTGPANMSLFCFSALDPGLFVSPTVALVFQPERRFGVVVVGLGRAGSVRMRDLRNPHASSAFLNLIGFVSRLLVFALWFVVHVKLNEMD